MQNRKKEPPIGYIVFISTIATLVLFIILFIMGISGVFNSAPPTPKIKYGEFPFQLTYELDGKLYVYSDSIVCEYEGVERYGDGSKRRVWKTYAKSTGDEWFRFLGDNQSENIPSFCFMVGNGEYYMGGERIHSSSEQSFEQVWYASQRPDGTIKTYYYTSDQAYEKFGFKFVSWECAPPIENEFK